MGLHKHKNCIPFAISLIEFFTMNEEGEGEGMYVHLFSNTN